MTLVIGLTGSIGTGKSTISKQCKKMNIPVIDADLIAREVVEPGKHAYTKIVDTFGPTILHDDRTLNRKALGEIVFNHTEKRNQLNGIIHPEIRKEMLERRDLLVNQHVPCIVMDIPLLFESKLTNLVDKIVVVSVDKKTQLERILARDNSTLEDAKQRIASQIPIYVKAEKADAVIDNNDSKENSYQQLENILTNWGIL